jgi:hypothetical protein
MEDVAHGHLYNTENVLFSSFAKKNVLLCQWLRQNPPPSLHAYTLGNFSVLKGDCHLEVKEGTGKHHILGGIAAV